MNRCRLLWKSQLNAWWSNVRCEVSHRRHSRPDVKKILLFWVCTYRGIQEVICYACVTTFRRKPNTVLPLPTPPQLAVLWSHVYVKGFWQKFIFQLYALTAFVNKPMSNVNSVTKSTYSNSFPVLVNNFARVCFFLILVAM